MKRFSAWLCLVAVALMVCAPFAQAGDMQSREVGWYVTAPNSGTTGVPTTPTPLKRDMQGVPDTTASFFVRGHDGIGAPAPWTASTADTLHMAYIQFASDSSVAVTNTFSSITFTVDGSNDGVTWSTALASQVRTPASGDGSILVPIWVKTTGTVVTGLVNPWLAYDQYRIRVTAATGNFFAAHCRLLYWSTNTKVPS